MDKHVDDSSKVVDRRPPLGVAFMDVLLEAFVCCEKNGHTFEHDWRPTWNEVRNIAEMDHTERLGRFRINYPEVYYEDAKQKFNFLLYQLAQASAWQPHLPKRWEKLKPKDLSHRKYLQQGLVDDSA